MLKIFDRYLLKEVIGGWLAVTAVLTLVLVSNQLVRFLGDAAEGDIPGNVVFQLLGLQIAFVEIRLGAKQRHPGTIRRTIVKRILSLDVQAGLVERRDLVNQASSFAAGILNGNVRDGACITVEVAQP